MVMCGMRVSRLGSSGVFWDYLIMQDSIWFRVGIWDRTNGESNGEEDGNYMGLRSVSATYFHGHGFLISDYTRDHTKLQEGALCPLLRFLY